MSLRTLAVVLALVALTSTLSAAPASAAEKLERRWLYLQMNFQVPENVPKAEALFRRAAKVGYNGVVVADYKLNILDRVPQHYFKNMEQVKKVAAELNLELIPTVAPIGYSDGLLAHNPNLAEGIPVRDATFVVQDGVAVLESQLQNALPGGGFEEHKKQAATGWGFQDGPGQFSFIDTQVKHSGQSSLRFDNPTGNARVSRKIKVQPWHQYHATVWIKTEGFENAREVHMFALADGIRLSHSNLGVKPTQEWTQHHVILNSLGNSEMQFYCGCWGGGKGKMWFDDIKLEETAFVNLLRRDGCPLSVATADGQPLKEGTDFAELADPKMGRVPWAGNFDVYHQPPQLKLLGSRVKSGDRLKVGFYHTVTIYDGQVTCCLANPEVFQVLAQQVQSVEKLLSPKTYFLSHDEIRVANWCQSCHRDGRTAGGLLAENMRRCVAEIRKINPKAQLCVWNDMFDPYHNAHDKFYLVDGDLAGSWEGLPKDMLIVNWNSGKAEQSLEFFAQRGHSQILAGYYDHDPARIAGWIGTAGKAQAPLSGAMYTTWRSNFSDLEKFAESAWGAK